MRKGRGFSFEKEHIECASEAEPAPFSLFFVIQSRSSCGVFVYFAVGEAVTRICKVAPLAYGCELPRTTNAAAVSICASSRTRPVSKAGFPPDNAAVQWDLTNEMNRM